MVTYLEFGNIFNIIKCTWNIKSVVKMVVSP